MKRQTRRQFVGSALSLVAAAMIPAVQAARPKRKDLLLITKLINMIEDPAAAEAFGTRYLHANPAEANTMKLVELVCGTYRSDFEDAPPGQRIALLRAQCHVDFKSGNVVDLLGWQLARTECRLFALASLT